jgi:hypothetical protein
MANNFFYTIIDILFNTMHIFAILINCFGWAFKKTLRINLLLLLITISSWSILGLFYGVGFCFLTMFHSLSLDFFGRPSIPFSYLDYIILEKLNINTSSNIISLTSIFFIFSALAISLKRNFITKDKTIIWLLWISCICWLIIVNEKGIGFIPDPTNMFIFLTLLASFTLIGKIFQQLLRKDF